MATYDVTALVYMDGQYHELTEQRTSMNKAERLARSWAKNPLKIERIVEGTAITTYVPAHSVSLVDIEEVI